MHYILSVKGQIAKGLIKATLLGCQYLHKQYQEYRKEVEQYTDTELFEIIQNFSAIHLKRISATAELIKRGYRLKDINT